MSTYAKLPFEFLPLAHLSNHSFLFDFSHLKAISKQKMKQKKKMLFGPFWLLTFILTDLRENRYNRDWKVPYISESVSDLNLLSQAPELVRTPSENSFEARKDTD